MIQQIDFPTNLVHVDDPIEITIHAPDPITVRVACFVNQPPPPRYKTCAECLTYTVANGGKFILIPNKTTWSNQQGDYGYEFTVTDATGDTRSFRVLMTAFRIFNGWAT